MHCVSNLFKEYGYTYFIIPKGSRSKIYFTKEQMNDTLFGQAFNDDVIFDEYKLEDSEKEILKIFPKNTFISLQSNV